MSVFLRKYNTLTVTGTTAIRIPMIKRAVVDFAVGADWTPAGGDVKIAIDGAAAANVTNLPTAVAMGNAGYWEFILTAAELTCKSSVVTVADSATKAVEDQAFIVETFGNASAMYQADLSAANLPANMTQILGTAVSTPATAGILDVNTKNINNVAAATPGASGGILISGSNSGTTTLGAFTVTGATTLTGAVSLGSTLGVTGTTTVAAVTTGAVTLGATSFAGLTVTAGATITGSANGVGLTISGGGTTGAGLVVNSTSGDAVQLTPTAGHALNATANGTSKHGFVVTGGTAGTSDGIKAVAGSGGVDIRGNQTGNLVGTVSTLTTYTGNTPQTGDAFARLGAPAGASVSVDIAAVKTDTAAVKVQTDKLAFTVTNQVDANVLDWKSATAPAMTGDAFARLGAPAGASVSADIAAVKAVEGAPAGASISADIAAIKAVIPAALVGGRMDSSVGAIAGTVAGATALDRSTRGIVIATVGAASTTTSIVTSAMTPAASVADQFKGRIVTFDLNTTTAALRGQSTDITANTNVGVLTVTALTDAAVSGDTFTVT